MRMLKNIWSWVLEQVDAIPLFFLHLYKEIAGLKWYESLPILMLILRIIRFPGDDQTVPMFSSISVDYTYHVFWYWLCSAVFEASIFYCLYRQKNLLLFLGLTYLGFGKIVDQFSLAAIQWCPTEIMWIGCTIIFLYTQWKKNLNDGSDAHKE